MCVCVCVRRGAYQARASKREENETCLQSSHNNSINRKETSIIIILMLMFCLNGVSICLYPRVFLRKISCFCSPGRLAGPYSRFYNKSKSTYTDRPCPTNTIHLCILII